MSRLLTNVASVVASDVLVKVVSLATTFSVARVLGPAQYGAWITLVLVVSYAPILALGSVETLLKQYPFYWGRGDYERAARLERGVFASVALAASAIVVGGGTVAALADARDGGWIPIQILMISATAALSLLSAFFYFRLSARQHFRMTSGIDAARAIASLACLSTLAWLWGLNGAMVGLLVVELAVCACSGYLCVRRFGPLSPHYDVQNMTEIVKLGFPITVIWWVFTIHNSADRLVALSVLGDVATGFYGLGVSMVTLVMLLPVAVSKVLYPRVNERIGQSTSRREDLKRLVIVPAQVLSMLVPLAIGVLVILTPFVYTQLLPRYAEGLASAQVLLLGSFFLCIARSGASFLVATDRQRAVLKYILLSLLLNVAAGTGLAKSGYGIVGVAAGSGASACLLGSLVWLAVFRHFGSFGRSGVKELGKLYLPYAAMLSVIGGIAMFAPGGLQTSGWHLATYALALLTGLGFVVWWSPSLRGCSIEGVCLLESYLRRRATG